MKNSIYILSFLLTGCFASHATNPSSTDPTVQNTSYRSSQSTDLLFFNYTAENSKVTLKWATAFESNTDHFSIERSLDGHTYNNISDHKGAGFSAVVTSYQYTDESPEAGISFYRLKKTKSDGTYEYAGTILCEMFIKDEYSFKFTNPVATDDLSISVTGEAANLQVCIYNAIGQKIINKSVIHSNSQSTISVPAADMQKGYYIIAITTPSGRIYSFPLSKV